MVGLRRRANKWLSTLVSEKRLFIQSGTATSYIRITPLAQLGLGSCALVAAGWVAFASSVAVIEFVASTDRTAQVRVLQDAYEARMQELATERDQSLAEAEASQGRFRRAMEQIGKQQSAILEVVEERRELASTLELMRGRLQTEAAAREGIVAANDELATRVGEVSATLDANRGNVDDLASTLDTISTALSEAVAERDAADADREMLASEVAELELQMQMNARHQDEMLGQLEQAVAMSFGPLEEMFSASDIDVDEVLSTVRGSYSGTGGPLSPATMSTRSFDDAGLGDRLGEVMVGLDRMNLLRIAAGRVPYAMPVTSSFRFTSGYGYRRDPKGGGRRLHRGIDLAGPRGTPIYATADGVVTSAKFESGYGNTVRIQHDFGFETVYAHQSRLLVRTGQQLSRGARIGDMGSTGRVTGVHLHYEVHLRGQPVNPMTYLEAARNVF
jgi:murein DD-endopeptidase MepM/ murein hydrolase activator NlpD